MCATFVFCEPREKDFGCARSLQQWKEHVPCLFFLIILFARKEDNFRRLVHLPSCHVHKSNEVFVVVLCGRAHVRNEMCQVTGDRIPSPSLAIEKRHEKLRVRVFSNRWLVESDARPSDRTANLWST